MLVKNSSIACVLFPEQEGFHSTHDSSKSGIRLASEVELVQALLCPPQFPEGFQVVALC